MASSSMLSSLLQSLPSSRFSFRINSGHFSIGAAGGSHGSTDSSSHPLLSVLESRLGDHLELLKAQEDEAGCSYLSAHWLNRALSVVLSTNSSVKAYVPDLQQALTTSDHHHHQYNNQAASAVILLRSWLDDSLDDNIRLLDISVALRHAVSGLKSYHAFVQLVLGLLETPSGHQPSSRQAASFRRALHAVSKCNSLLKQKLGLDQIQAGFPAAGASPPAGLLRRSKLDSCGSMLRRMAERLHDENAMKASPLSAIYATQITTILVCVVLSTALSPSNQRRSGFPVVAIPSQSGWALALMNLQHRVKDQMEKRKSKNHQKVSYLEEIEHVDATLQTLNGLISGALSCHQFPLPADVEEPIHHVVSDLRMFSDDLAEGLAQLEEHTAELYHVLITSRMMMLDIYPKSSAISRQKGL